MLEIGSLVEGKYKILNKIGQGGMSRVYLAMNERANKQWAVKEVRKDGLQNFQVVKQGLLAETEMLKKLSHPNLPEIVDIIETEETFLMVMDYIEGQSLECMVREYGAQNQEDVVAWVKQLCDVLSYLHSRKPPIIYRDMKPSNIMLKPDGQVMLIDFGTAREMKESSGGDTNCLGTRGYAAPEQYGGHGQTDIRTDIYGLGATLYHLLTGRSPEEPPYEMFPIRHWKPELSSGLEEIVEKCTRKNPQERYQNCGELFYALEHYRELDQEYKKVQTRRWRGFWCSFALSVLTGLGGVGFCMAENLVTANTYEACIQEAGNLAATDTKACIRYYENAISLNPGKGQAYEELLNYFLWVHKEEERRSDEEEICVFSPAEEQEMRKVLGTGENRNQRNEEYLKQNREEYHKFSYTLGIAYFYSYNGTGNKGAAKKWLKSASQAEPGEGLNETEVSRAEKLYKISQYYDSLGIRSRAGDSMASYYDYWIDLAAIAEDDLESQNNVNILLTYQELTAQIAVNASDFKRAGVTRKQIEKVLSAGEEAIEHMEIIAEKASAVYEREMKEGLSEDFAGARAVVQGVFHTENKEEDI